MAESSPAASVNVVKEGWLFKRGKLPYNNKNMYIPSSFYSSGEHIKNWRQRYFILKEDGQFIGFKQKPTAQDLNDPLNNFTVKGCQIMTADRPKNFTFFIRGLQMTTVVERMFHVETGAEREEWLAAIEGVKKKLDETKEVETATMAGDEEMPDTAEETDPFETIFAKRGTVQKKSGSEKLVRTTFYY